MSSAQLARPAPLMKSALTLFFAAAVAGDPLGSFTPHSPSLPPPRLPGAGRELCEEEGGSWRAERCVVPVLWLPMTRSRATTFCSAVHIPLGPFEGTESRASQVLGESEQVTGSILFIDEDAIHDLALLNAVAAPGNRHFWLDMWGCSGGKARGLVLYD